MIALMLLVAMCQNAEVNAKGNAVIVNEEICMAALVEHGIVIEYHVWGGHLDVDRAIGRLLTKLGCSNGVVIVMGFVCSVWFVCFLRFFPFYLLFFNLFACPRTIYSQSPIRCVFEQV